MLIAADTANRALRPVTYATLKDAMDELKTLVEYYESNRSQDIRILVQFSRANLSRALARMADDDFACTYNQPMFDAVRLLLRDWRYGGLLTAVPPLSNEADLIESITDPERNAPGSVALKKSFIIGAFYFHPFRVPNVLSLLKDPGPFFMELVCCFCRSPKVFETDAEHAEYVTFLEALFGNVLDQLESHTAQVAASSMANDFATRVSLHPIYSFDGSVRRFQTLKARLLEHLIEQKHGTKLDTVLPPADPNRGRIRIGFLWHDGDARTETFVGLAHLRGLNRGLFEVHSVFFSSSYAQATEHDSLAAEIKAHSDVVIDLGGRLMQDMVDTIREADFDLLFIVNNITWGWSDYIGLAAHRLARVQIVNYCAVTTTGFRNIDVWLSAEDSEVESAEKHYTEALVRMPGSVLCFDRLEFPVILRKTIRRADFGVPDTATLFVSGANFYKLTPKLTATWAEILARRPDAHLVLYPMNPNWDGRYPLSALRRRLARQLQERSVPEDRIHIVGPWHDHDSVFALLDTCDVYLDSFPHAGGISTSDALLLGLPTVTLRGRFQHGIQGANALEALGLQDWIVETVDDYIEKALLLADDPSLRAALHLKMLENLPTSVLLDVEAFGIKLSDTLCDIYRQFAVERAAIRNDTTVPHTTKNSEVA